MKGVLEYFNKLLTNRDSIIIDKDRNVLAVVTNTRDPVQKNVCLPDFLTNCLTQIWPLKENSDLLNDLIYMSFTKDDDLEFVKTATDEERYKHYLFCLSQRKEFTFYDLEICGLCLKGDCVFVRTNGKFLKFGDMKRLQKCDWEIRF